MSLRSLAFLACLGIAIAKPVVLDSSVGNEDLTVESTIVRQDFVYPDGSIGYGTSGYSTYSSKSPVFLGGGGGGGGGGQPQLIGLPVASPNFIQPPPQVGPQFFPPQQQQQQLSFQPQIPNYGSSEASKSSFGQDRKQQNDNQFQQGQGRKGEEFQSSKQGFSQGNQGSRERQGQSGSFSGEQGARRLNDDQRNFFGTRRFQQEGQNGAQRKENRGFNRGRVVKGFNKSHSKDESGRSEQFYDEEHDEGGNIQFSGLRGNFGENEGASFRGIQQDGRFNTNQGRQQGFSDSQRLLDNSSGNGEQFGARKFGSNGSNFGYNSGADEQSLLARQQSSKQFSKQPQSVPFYPSL